MNFQDPAQFAVDPCRLFPQSQSPTPIDFYQESRKFLEEMIKAEPSNVEILKVYEKLISNYTEWQNALTNCNLEQIKLQMERNKNHLNSPQPQHRWNG